MTQIDEGGHAEPAYDANGLQILEPAECLALLRESVVGRVVFTDGALPAVQPVNFVVDDDGSVVLKSAAGSRLSTVVVGNVVAFEVDQIDSATASGWSVVVTGHLHTVRGTSELARVRRLPLRSFVPMVREHYLRVVPELVTGRRLTGYGIPAHQP